ncbi:MAG: glycoside hydrolase family 3 [Ignavibacteria bacterium]|nr:glycoside hydrolase family 3 [Ignavibacteria bacterium]
MMEKISFEEKVGQKIIIGFRGTTLKEEPIIIDYLKEGFIGGVILFEKDAQNGKQRNLVEPKQIQNLINEIKVNSKHIPFISIDQEGGKVSRLNSNNGFEDFPSSKKVAMFENIEFAEEIYDRMANILQNIGINVNFAPVVDLCINSENEVVVKKERCFSSEPEVVAKFAKSFIQCHLKRKILPVAKHFPGHGSSTGDTHLDWVDITNTWKQVELKPYQILLENNFLLGVMVGHLFNKNIDPLFPASLSHIWVDEVLRKQLGFNGLVFTDDMQMKAISNYFSLEEIVELAFNCSIDVLVFANQLYYETDLPERIITISKELVSKGKIVSEKIEESFQRIVKFKKEIMFN